jgi:protein-S-isoprenylcysteine O-methyltransferase Ste14
MNPDPTAPMRKSALILRAVLQAVTQLILFGIVIFVPAGTLHWPTGWAMLILFIGGTLLFNLWLAARHPGLARERLIIPRTSEKWDLRLTSVTNFLLLAVMLPLAGVDRRLGLSPAVPIAASAGAMLFFALMFFLMAWAASANDFFSSAVRLQSDRGHTVATGGPYRIVRHPGYAAMIIQFLSVPPALGSIWGLVPAAAGCAVYVYRTAREDAFLRKNLAGYEEYIRQVRHRLIPGIW